MRTNKDAMIEADAGTETSVLQRLCRNLTECSPFPMVAVEGRTYIVRYVNPAFCRHSHKTQEELIGRPIAGALPEENAKECLALLDQVYRMGEPENPTAQGHSQSYFHSACRSYAVWAVLDEGMRPAGLMIQVMDTTKAAILRQ